MHVFRFLFFFVFFLFYTPGRQWYQNALIYTFDGTFDEAFPLNTTDFDDFYSGSGVAGGTEECTSAVSAYIDLFSIAYSYENGSNSDDGYYYYYSSTNVSLNSSTDVSWSRYIWDTGGIGLSGSKAIVNDTTGELLAVVLVDYSLDELSVFLNETNDDSDWLSWIFETNTSDMVASSDGQVLTTVSGLAGLSCVSDSEEYVSLEAVDHPNDDIKIFSEAIYDVEGVDALPINSSTSVSIPTIIDSPYVEAGRLQYWPGILDDDTGIDFVIVKAIDVDALDESIEDDQMITLIVSFFVVFLSIYGMSKLEKAFRYRSLKPFSFDNDTQKDDNELNVHEYEMYQSQRILDLGSENYISDDSDSDNEQDKTVIADRTHFDVKDDWSKIIADRLRIEWSLHFRENICTNRINRRKRKSANINNKYPSKNKNKSQKSTQLNHRAKSRSRRKSAGSYVSQTPINGTNDEWNNNKDDNSQFALITMRDAKDFCFERAKYFLSYKDSTRMIDKTKIFDECFLVITNKYNRWMLHFIMDIMPTRWYILFIESTIILHILTAFSEPATPNLLSNEGWGWQLTTFVFICIVIEWFDLSLRFLERYARFDVRTNKENPHIGACQRIELGNGNTQAKLNSFLLFWNSQSDILRVFVGPKNRRFNMLVVCNVLVLFNFLTTIGFRWGFFSYYIPILPFLYMYHNQNMHYAVVTIYVALKQAKDVLLLFLTTLLLAACLGIGLFKDALNIDSSINNYSQLSRALVTSFVFITTGENYNDLVAQIITDYENSQVLLVYFFVAIVFAMFCLVPGIDIYAYA